MNLSRPDISIDELNNMDPQDRELLLSVDPSEQLGLIIRLNQEPRYRNSLDAIALIADLQSVAPVRSSSLTARA